MLDIYFVFQMGYTNPTSSKIVGGNFCSKLLTKYINNKIL